MILWDLRQKSKKKKSKLESFDFGDISSISFMKLEMHGLKGIHMLNPLKLILLDIYLSKKLKSERSERVCFWNWILFFQSEQVTKPGPNPLIKIGYASFRFGPFASIFVATCL